MNSSTFQTQDVRPYAKELSGSKFYWPISSPSSLIPDRYALGDIQPGPNGKTTLTQPHAGAAVILQKLAADWWDALRMEKALSENQVDDRTASATFKNAITVSRCGEPQRMNSSERIVYFPSIAGRFDFAESLHLEVQDLNANQTDQVRFQWVHLPSEFGAASIGALFESPWESPDFNSSSRAVIGCTVQAGWVPATVYTDKYTFWTGWYPWNILFGDRTPAYDLTSTNSTNGRVALGDSWLDLLTPLVTATKSNVSSRPPSTIESIFNNAGLILPANDWLATDDSGWKRVSLVEAIICSVVLDGLSRTGSYRIFDGTGSPSQWSLANYTPLAPFNSLILDGKKAMQPPSDNADEFVAIEAEMKISGFSMQSSLATFLAMSVLLIHIAMATVHTAYIILQRHASASWNTIGELIALSQNSKPSFAVLGNTGGGIKRSKTYSHVARIRAIQGTAPSDHKHLELLFDGAACSGKDGGNADGCELHRVRSSRLFHPATWPRPQTRLWDSEAGNGLGLSSSTEWLVPGVPLGAREREREAPVQMDYRYS